MATLSEVITHALAPGIALTSAILYNSTLQARIVHITNLVRDLNREARERAQHNEKRLASIDKQVRVLARRARVIRYGIGATFFAFFCFILTTLGSLASGVVEGISFAWPSLTLFSLGFACMAGATVFTAFEVFLGHKTLTEDIRSSLEDVRTPVHLR